MILAKRKLKCGETITINFDEEQSPGCTCCPPDPEEVNVYLGTPGGGIDKEFTFEHPKQDLRKVAEVLLKAADKYDAVLEKRAAKKKKKK